MSNRPLFIAAFLARVDIGKWRFIFGLRKAPGLLCAICRESVIANRLANQGKLKRIEEKRRSYFIKFK